MHLLLLLLAVAHAWTPIEDINPRPHAIEVSAGLPLAPGRPAPRLVVDCVAGRWSLRLEAGVMAAYTGIGDEWEEAYAAIAYAFDGDTPRNGKLRRDTTNLVLWWPKPKKALRTFELHRSFELYFTPTGQTQPAKLSFNIDGLADARAAMPECLR